MQCIDQTIETVSREIATLQNLIKGLAQWRAKNWVEKEDFDVYRKAKTYGL